MGETGAEAVAKGDGALVEGAIIGGRYRLEGEIGVGAMGIVRTATHTTLGHQVAIKFLLKSVMASEEARTRFEREAKLAARLGEASRHITKVFDHGLTDDNVPYLVMELLRGESLSARLKRERRLPLGLATRIVQQLARALHVAHSAGVVHRDLKPANVFLCNPEQGDEVEVKLLDFGIAKASADDDEQNTGQGQVLGTPSYMSPEQVLSEKPVDARSDLWAVAAIVYRMVAGRAPFGSGPVQEIALRIMSTEAIPPSQVATDLPIELDMWMQRGLAKNPDERFQTARELADFLASVAGVSTTGVAAPRPQPEAHEETGPSHASTTGSQIHSSPPVAPRSRILVPVAIGVATILGIVLIVSLARRGEPATAPATAASSVPSTTAPSVAVATASPSLEPSASASTAPASSVAAAPSTSGSAKTTKVKKNPDGSGWDNKHEL
jgi:serine/threonine-protein kinase